MDILDYKYAPAPIVQAVNRLIRLKKTSSPWEVIKEIIKVWEKEYHNEYDSFLIDLKTDKETRKVTSIGNKQFTGVSKTGDGILRYTLDIPVRVVKMIRALYSPEELPMDKQFYKEMGKRYPKFKISEKL